MRATFLGKTVECGEHTRLWRVTRWPFVGTIAERGPKFTYRIKLHPVFQSTDILAEGVGHNLDEACWQLDRVAKEHMRAMTWYLRDDKDDDERED